MNNHINLQLLPIFRIFNAVMPVIKTRNHATILTRNEQKLATLLKLKTFLYAPFVPQSFGKVFREYQKPNHKKLLYSNDPVGNILLSNTKNLKNTLVFSKRNPFINTHQVITYQQSPDVLNKDLSRFIN